MSRLLFWCWLAGATGALTSCGSPEDESLGAGGMGGVGGDLSSGGAGSTGGASTGGLETGGALTGGLTSGGLASGGAPTGGTASGGLPSGGASTGGVATGGVSFGGTPTGGAPTGGAPTGGAATGGAESGGASTGGTADGGSGGAQTGGAPTGGVPSGGASTGGTPTGGAPTGGSGDGGTGAAVTGDFELAWEDSFDTVDLSRWELMTHSWDGNLAQFGAENATASGGILSLSLTSADDADRPFRGVEMRSRETLTYGKVEVSTRFAAGSAVVSSLVLIYTPWPPDDWNELDIEFLGKNTDRVQCNHMINVPPADPQTEHLQFPQLVTLPFNPAAAFHTFAIEWVPGEARFLVDGTVMHTATEEMARMVLPQNILLTIWASDSAAWAGPVDSTTAPTSAEYDWIRVYRYVGS